MTEPNDQTNSLGERPRVSSNVHPCSCPAGKGLRSCWQWGEGRALVQRWGPGQAGLRYPLPGSTCQGLRALPASCPPRWQLPGPRRGLLAVVACRLPLPVACGDLAFFNLPFILRTRPSEISFDVGPLPGEESRVSEAWSGFCPLPPAQAGPRGLPTIRARPPG